MGRSRYKPIATARHVCAYLLRKKLNYTLMGVGTELNRHHTTIMNSIIVVEDDLDLQVKAEEIWDVVSQKTFSTIIAPPKRHGFVAIEDSA